MYIIVDIVPKKHVLKRFVRIVRKYLFSYKRSDTRKNLRNKPNHKSELSNPSLVFKEHEYGLKDKQTQ